MMHRTVRLNVHLHLERLEGRDAPAASIWDQTFEGLPEASIPPGWQQWNPTFGVRQAVTIQGEKAFATAGSSLVTSRAWHSQVMPADFGVSSFILLDALQPLQLIARGRDLSSSMPMYYGVEITRGLEVKLVQVVDGVATTLATIKSKDYVSGKWVRVSLQPTGDRLTVEVQRADTGKYLTSTGVWQAAPTFAIDLTSVAIQGGGQVGYGRPAKYSATVMADDFRVLVPPTHENFDTTAVGNLPSGWSDWSNVPAARFRTSAAIGQSAPHSLISSASASTALARTWVATTLPPDVQVSASIYLNSLAAVRLLARGRQLDSSSPTYYGLSVARGMQVQLVRVVAGVPSIMGTVTSTSYLSNKWVRATLTVVGDRVQVLIYRGDTGQYLTAAGEWKDGIARAIDLEDDAITPGGFAGLERPASYAGTVTVDDFEVNAAGGDVSSPIVILHSPEPGATLTGLATVSAAASDNGPIERLEFYVDGTLRFSTTQAAYDWVLDSASLENGTHVLSVSAFDLAGNVGSAAVSVTSSNVVLPRPTIPRHYSHVRVAALAYHGTPFTSFEKTLLANSIDLVIPHPMFLAPYNAIAANTPQLIYSNVSNLYEQLLTDWLEYADAQGLDRELAFYHAAKPAAWSHDSASSLPVKHFWSVRRGASVDSTTNYTSASRNSAPGDVPFGLLGQSTYIGFVERFREINFDFYLGGSNGWKGVLEYASAVDANGKPSAWKTMPTLSDTTSGFTKSGKIEFDPPADWKASNVAGSPSLFHVRVRTTAAGNSPVATTIHGRNYSNSNGNSPPSGVTPAFDAAADVNGDGYLNTAEYAARAANKNARFEYESRIHYPYYGEMRLALNPASAAVREWAADYHRRFLEANPLADGLFMDNSAGRLTLGATVTLESTASYAQDYAALLNVVGHAIAPKFIAANTSNGGAQTDHVVRNSPVWVEEFAIRALAHTFAQFEDLAALVKHRQSLKSPSAYAIIDSLPTNGSTTDPRTLMATLAYYYLLGDPDDTFLMFFGGYDPNSPWSERWVPAVTYDVGQPKGAFNLFAEGNDPANANLKYKVYERKYENARVLYKPLSYKLGSGTGGIGSNTATTHQLGGSYRVLNALGSLSAPVTSVSLRNGEGVILVPA